MKGVVYTLLSEMVESRFGLETWDSVLDDSQPESEGIYVATDTYPDSELSGYVTALSSRLGLPPEKIVFAFGEFMAGKFAEMHPEFFEGHDAKSFLKSVHDVIHVEVKKLHPEAMLPDFQYEDPGEGRLTMKYSSPRKLCALAEGLIASAGAHYDTDIALTHDTCMLRGDDHCRLELTLVAGRAAKLA